MSAVIPLNENVDNPLPDTLYWYPYGRAIEWIYYNADGKKASHGMAYNLERAMEMAEECGFKREDK